MPPGEILAIAFTVVASCLVFSCFVDVLMWMVLGPRRTRPRSEPRGALRPHVVRASSHKEPPTELTVAPPDDEPPSYGEIIGVVVRE
jgi:hypothetical protein